jgi:hypothetical protein
MRDELEERQTRLERRAEAAGMAAVDDYAPTDCEMGFPDLMEFV